MADDLVISVGASIRDLERQMKAAAQVAEKRADEIEGEFKRRNPSFAGDFGLGVLKGAIAGLAIDQIAKQFIEANREVASFGDTARRVGLDLVKFQSLRLAASGEGIAGKAFDEGVDALAKKLNDARREENELTKILEANNLKLKDRTGEVIGTNEALAIAADLISRAATEQDKVKIAEAFGLPKDFVPLLEGGAEALAEMARKAAEAGTILDSDVIAKAKEFDTAWSSAWAGFASNAKASILSASQGLASLITQAGQYLAAVNAGNKAAVAADRDLRAQRRNEAFQMGLGNAGGRSSLDAERAAEARGRTAAFRQSEIDLRNRQVDATLPPTRPSNLRVGGSATKIPSDKKGGGGSGGGKSEDDKAQERLDKYIESLVRQRAVMEAEIATVGKSNAERKAAVEIAKAQVDLEKLSTTAKAEYIAKLTEEVGKNEEVRASKERLEAAQKGLNDAQKYFGNAAVDALEDLIINGAKAEDVVKRLAASLAKAALQAVLIGEGPLAALFGTKGSDGKLGGLFGSLFGRAGGGPVNAGQAYKVGERGAETFVPTTPGRIVSAGKLGGSSYAPTYNIDARGADPAAVARIEQGLAARDRQFGRNVQAVNRQTSLRGTRA